MNRYRENMYSDNTEVVPTSFDDEMLASLSSEEQIEFLKGALCSTNHSLNRLAKIVQEMQWVIEQESRYQDDIKERLDHDIRTTQSKLYAHTSAWHSMLLVAPKKEE